MRESHPTSDHVQRLIGLRLMLVACTFFAVPINAQSASVRLDCNSISSTILGRAVAYCVALPPGYETGSARYPALYFLHGLFENEKSWSEHGGLQTWETLLSQGKIGEFIIVVPDAGKSFYVNSFDGRERYEDFFMQELIPAIDQKYRTLANRDARGISGVSMGGFGAQIGRVHV